MGLCFKKRSAPLSEGDRPGDAISGGGAQFNKIIARHRRFVQVDQNGTKRAVLFIRTLVGFFVLMMNIEILENVI